MSTQFNPYAAPQYPGSDPIPRKPRQLADLGKRFLGALIDGFFGFALIVPGYGLMIAGGGLADQDNPEINGIMLLGIGLLLVGGIASLVIQVYLLATRSQSLGKYVMNTQIVDYRTGEPAGLVNTLLLRIFVNGIIGAIPCVGPIYSIVDILFIFGDERRCLHDQLASTSVVDLS